MRSLTLALLGLLAVGCGDDGAEPPPRGPSTELRITLWPAGRDGDAPPHTWTLTCDPPGGTHPAPEAACRALAANESALRPVPRDAVCTQVYGGPEVAVIEGTYRGAPLTASFNRTNGCEIGRWDRLAPLLPRVGDA